MNSKQKQVSQSHLLVLKVLGNADQPVKRTMSQSHLLVLKEVSRKPSGKLSGESQSHLLVLKGLREWSLTWKSIASLNRTCWY